MPNDIKFSDEFIENFINNTFDLWFDSALNEKGLGRDDFKKGQVLFKSPFALSQFADLDTKDSDVEVGINDDIELTLIARVDTDREIKKGDPIYGEEIEGFDEVKLDDGQEDYGYIIVAKLDGFGWYFNFDFRRNRSYYKPLIDTADQFIKLSEYAKENELWRGFVENAFHAAERMMKIDVIFMGWPAERHDDVQARYADLVEIGKGSSDLYDVFNQLKDKYRFSASYVDPRGDVDEKEFNFDKEYADKTLSIIKEHRESLSDEF